MFFYVFVWSGTNYPGTCVNMGAVTSRIPFLKENPDDNPANQEYYVHGLHYWPGKCTPFSLWPTLLPDYQENKLKNENSQSATTTEATSPLISPPTACKHSTTSLSRRNSSSDPDGEDSSTNPWLLRIRPDYINTLIRRARLRAMNTVNSSYIRRNRRRHYSNSSNTSSSKDIQNIQDIKLNVIKNNSLNSNGKVHYTRNTSSSNSCRSSLTIEQVSCDSSDGVKPEDRWKHYSYPFENIALSGGGMKGYAYIGAIKVCVCVVCISSCKKLLQSVFNQLFS